MSETVFRKPSAQDVDGTEQVSMKLASLRCATGENVDVSKDAIIEVIMQPARHTIAKSRLHYS